MSHMRVQTFGRVLFVNLKDIVKLKVSATNSNKMELFLAKNPKPFLLSYSNGQRVLKALESFHVSTLS